MFTPKASSASALPLLRVLLRLPCLATTAPAAAAMIAAHVEILKVLIPFPPVLQVSIAFIGAVIPDARSRIAKAAPAISSTLTPFACNKANKAAACTETASSLIIQRIISRASSKLSSVDASNFCSNSFICLF